VRAVSSRRLGRPLSAHFPESGSCGPRSFRPVGAKRFGGINGRICAKRFATLRPLLAQIAVNGRDEHSFLSSPGLPAFGTKRCDEPINLNPAVVAHGTLGTHGNRGQEVSCLTLTHQTLCPKLLCVLRRWFASWRRTRIMKQEGNVEYPTRNAQGRGTWELGVPYSIFDISFTRFYPQVQDFGCGLAPS